MKIGMEQKEVLQNVAFLSLDGQLKVPLQARIVVPTINFTNGQGSVVVNTEGKTISSIAFASHSGLTSTLGVTGISVNNQTNTISISLSNTTYNGLTEFNILYFIVA